MDLNGVAVAFNRGAFQWGRRAAVDRASVEARAIPKDALPESHRLSETLDELVGRRVEFLSAYQNAAYAGRYFDRVQRVRDAEAARLAGSTALTEAASPALCTAMA